MFAQSSLSILTRLPRYCFIWILNSVIEVPMEKIECVEIQRKEKYLI